MIKANFLWILVVIANGDGENGTWGLLLFLVSCKINV